MTTAELTLIANRRIRREHAAMLEALREAQKILPALVNLEDVPGGLRAVAQAEDKVRAVLAQIESE